MAEILPLKERFALYRRAIGNADDMPAYKVLQRIIQMSISNGDWKEGEAIPPERLIAEQSGMSVGTVKRAMLNLVNEGVLFRRQGSGTYVAMSSFARPFRRYYLFLENFSDTESKNQVALLEARLMPPQPRINHLLRIDGQEQLVRVTRTFQENGRVNVLCQSSFPAGRFSDLLKVPPSRFVSVPLFVILEEDFHIRHAFSDELFDVSVPNAEEAGFLGLSAGSAALRVRALHSANDGPYEYRESLCQTANKAMYRHVTYDRR